MNSRFSEKEEYGLNIRPIRDRRGRYKYLHLLVFLFGLGVIFCFFAFWISFNQDRASKVQFEAGVQALSSTISSSLWHYDITEIEVTTKSFIQVWDVSTVKVTDQYGSIISSSGIDQGKQPADTFLNLVSDNAQIIGKVEVWLNPNSNAIIHPIYLTFFFAYLISLIFSLVVFYRFREKTINEPLSHLLDNTEKWLLSHGHHRKARTSVSKLDELDENVSKIIFVSNQNTLERHKAIKHSNDNTEILLAQLKRSLATFVLTDSDGKLAGVNIASPFTDHDKSELQLLASGKTSLSNMFANLSFDVVQVENTVFSERHSHTLVKLEGGDLIKIDQLSLPGGLSLLTAASGQESAWTNQLLREFMVETGNGFAVFDPQGKLYFELGKSLSKMLKSGKSPTTIADYLASLPAVGALEPMTPQQLEYEGKDNCTYRMRLFKDNRGWVGVFLQDISSEKLSQIKVRESEKMATIGEISSELAHNFNNALGVVIGRLELSQRKGQDKKQILDNISVGLDSANQAAGIVSQILSFSKEPKLDGTQIQVDEFFIHNRNIIETALTKTHRVEFDLNSAVSVLVDPVQFSSVVLNLVINAKNAMEKPGVVTIATQHILDKDFGDVVKIAISDTGPGIPTQIQKKIFDPLFTSNKKGSGLGLTSAKGVIEQNGGVIDFETSKKGTKFIITLPVNAASHPSDVKNEIDDIIQNFRVLLVDDDEILRKTQAALMEDLGVEVFAFEKGADAIKFLEEGNHISHAIIDLRMPNMPGYEVALKVRGLSDSVKIWIMSGNPSAEDEIALKKIGVQTVLRKPVKFEKFKSLFGM